MRLTGNVSDNLPKPASPTHIALEMFGEYTNQVRRASRRVVKGDAQSEGQSGGGYHDVASRLPEGSPHVSSWQERDICTALVIRAW